MKLDINQDSDQIINRIDELIKNEDGLSAIQDALLKSIESYDFLGNYHYAYLLDELNYPELSNYITDKTIANLHKCLLGF